MRMPISYSRASKFEQCPALFKAVYLDKVPETKGVPLLVGIFMHDLTDRYIKHCVKHGMKSDYDYMLKAFEEMWSTNKADGIPEATKPELEAMCLKIREGMVLEDVRSVVGSEISLALTYEWQKTKWFAANVFIRMKIDLMEMDQDRRVKIKDLKTGHAIDDAEDSEQLKLYGAAAKALIPNVEDIEVSLFYARLGVWKTHKLTEEDIAQGRAWITGVSARIERALQHMEFPATPGRGCATCPVFGACEARKRQAEAVPAQTQAEAEDILERYIVVDRERKLLQEILKTWIQVNGPLVVNGKMAELALQRRVHMPGYETLKILSDSKVMDPMSYLKGDTDALKKLVRGNQALAEALEKIAEDESITKFQVKNCKG